jgi:hypothetical protein
MAETGLNQNTYRDYDPMVGRYVESDLIGLHGGLNTYAYSGSDPVAYDDPLGLLCRILWGLNDSEKNPFHEVNEVWSSGLPIPFPSGQTQAGADLKLPTSKSPTGGIGPAIDIEINWWMSRLVYLTYEDGYTLHTWFEGLQECTDVLPCGQVQTTTSSFHNNDIWQRVVTRRWHDWQMRWDPTGYKSTWSLPLPEFE